jgi:hypothetical protein
MARLYTDKALSGATDIFTLAIIRWYLTVPRIPVLTACGGNRSASSVLWPSRAGVTRPGLLPLPLFGVWSVVTGAADARGF